jgi:hypothetical protein
MELLLQLNLLRTKLLKIVDYMLSYSIESYFLTKILFIGYFNEK